MTAFTWLNDLMQWVARWVPRLALIPATHRGVLFLPRGRTKELQPGLWWWWPIFSELHKVCMNERTVLTSAQLVNCRLVAVTVTWRVTEAKATKLKYRDVESRLENAAIAAAVANTDPDTIRQDLSRVFGNHIEVIEVRLVSDGFGLAIKNFDDSVVREYLDTGPE